MRTALRRSLTRVAICLSMIAGASCDPPDNTVYPHVVQPEATARVLSDRGTRLASLRPPSVSYARDRQLLVYEIALAQPLGGTPFSIQRMDISAGSIPFASVGAPTIAASTILRDAENRIVQPTSTTIGAGQIAVVYMLHELRRDSVVTDNLAVSVVLQYADGQTETTVLDIPVLAVDPVVLGAPLRGGPWLATNALSNTSTHRRAMPAIPYLRVPERYAIDYVLADDAGIVALTPGTKNTDYLCYGQEVLAGGDGTVARVTDNIPDNNPGASAYPSEMKDGNVYGNSLVLSLRTGGHVLYGHLKPSSIKLKVGDPVKKGDVIGLVGNSGDSTTPHLHIHVADRLDALDKEGMSLGSEGVPFAFERFAYVGKPGYERFGEKRITWGQRTNEAQASTLPTEGEANSF
jgi:hypothetical protein